MAGAGVGPAGSPGGAPGPAWPAEMGSVSSARARSRSAVVQLGPSPAQPEAPPAVPAAARGDPLALPKPRGLGPGRSETPAPAAAWEAPRAARSPEARAELASAELSPVLKPAAGASRPDSPGSRGAGKSPHQA